MKLDWDHFYMLGWYGDDGKARLTTWDGDAPMVYAVVRGIPEHKMTVWAAPVPPGAELLEIPAEKALMSEKRAYAREVGGFLAFGWYIEAGFNRKNLMYPLWGPRS